MFWSHHKTFIRRSWYSVLLSLDAMISCRIKKAVVGVTQLVTALVSIHSSMTFLADMYSFLDPPGRTLLFSVDDCGLFPVDCVIGLIRMVGECTYPQGRSSSYESRRGQLTVESRLRPLSWCDSWSSHQDSEELSTSFFWWRSRDEIETSK